MTTPRFRSNRRNIALASGDLMAARNDLRQNQARACPAENYAPQNILPALICSNDVGRCDEPAGSAGLNAPKSLARPAA
jgi:hypothetical protein